MAEIKQQLTMEIKQKRKTQKFYVKLLENSKTNKGKYHTCYSYQMVSLLKMIFKYYDFKSVIQWRIILKLSYVNSVTFKKPMLYSVPMIYVHDYTVLSSCNKTGK